MLVDLTVLFHTFIFLLNIPSSPSRYHSLWWLQISPVCLQIHVSSSNFSPGPQTLPFSTCQIPSVDGSVSGLHRNTGTRLWLLSSLSPTPMSNQIAIIRRVYLLNHLSSPSTSFHGCYSSLCHEVFVPVSVTEVLKPWDFLSDESHKGIVGYS